VAPIGIGVGLITCCLDELFRIVEYPLRPTTMIQLRTMARDQGNDICAAHFPYGILTVAGQEIVEAHDEVSADPPRIEEATGKPVGTLPMVKLRTDYSK
jgi:hypothetical protein